jgi:hypothetical protein
MALKIFAVALLALVWIILTRRTIHEERVEHPGMAAQTQEPRRLSNWDYDRPS